MAKKTYRNFIAWIIVTLFFAILPTISNASVVLTGKSFQQILANETIVGYELTKQYNPYPGGSVYSYSSKPIYYDPYQPNVVRTLTSVNDAPIKYPNKVKVKDLLGMKDINGKKIFTIGDSATAVGMSGAKAIAKRALTGLPAMILTEWVDPETLSDGTIKGSGYELGVLSSSTDPEITVAEIQAKIALRNGIDPYTTADPYDPVENDYYHDGYLYNFSTTPGANGYNYLLKNLGSPAIGFNNGGQIGLSPASNVRSMFKFTHWVGDKPYYTNYLYVNRAPSDPPSGFNPVNYPELYTGTEGSFNAISELLADDAEVEMIPLDPANIPTYFPDTDTGFMSFGGRTEIGGEDYLLGPDYTAVLNPPGVTWNNGLPYVDPSSIGYIADPVSPGGQTTIVPGEIIGIPKGSKILSVDPKTGLIKFQTPGGYESSIFGSKEQIQNLQNKVSSPYLDSNGAPMTWGGSTGGNSTSTTKTVVADREDYSVNIPGIPDPPEFPSTFDVPEPEPWPWQQWVSNPIKTMLDQMEITASGSPYLNFPIEFPWYPAFNITIDFSEYENEISSIGGYMVAIAYMMAVLIVVRAKN